MTSAVFTLEIPSGASIGTERYVRAVFESSDRTVSDTVLHRILQKTLVLRDWINYRKGWHHFVSSNNSELILSRPGKGDYYGNIYHSAPVLFASDTKAESPSVRICPFDMQ